MSSGENLHEMEVGTTQSRTAVNSGAKGGDPMQKLAPGAVAGQSGSWEDLGGPTPENYKSDDDSSKFKDASATLKQVRDVVNKNAGKADSMPAGIKEDEDLEDEIIAEDEEVETEEEQEIVAEEDVEGDEEEEEVVEEEYDVEEDVNAILSTDEVELSEEFREKAKVVFESALKSRVGEIREALEARYEEALAEEVAEIKEALQERVDSYLEYVADEWIAENQLSVEQGLKEELTESFMSGLKNLFEEHYVSIPEEKYDVLNSMVEKLDEMESKLNEQIEKNVSLNKRLAESVADGIFDEIAEGLALSQKEKLASLAESVEFGSENEYREKLVALREAYFSPKVAAQQTKTETLTEGVEVSGDINPAVAKYAQMLSRMSKN